jgi:hypothetical protein
MNKKILAVAISSALAVPMAAHAIKASVSGHVNRAINFIDDGAGSSVHHVDGMASHSRLRVVGSGDLGVGGIKVGTVLEWGVASSRSSGVTVKGNQGNGSGTDLNHNIRHSRLWFSGGWGKVTMGHGSGAADGSLYKDQGGSVFLSGIEQGGSTFGGAIAYRTSAGGASGATVGGSGGGFDGGRYDNLRYDTPKFGPLSAAIDVGDNERWSASVSLSSKFSGASIIAKVGYEDFQGVDTLASSAGILFSQGTNISVSYSTTDSGNDPDNFYIKLGHRWGPDRVNSIAIDYQVTDDKAAAGDEATAWGIGFAHDIPGPKVTLYTGYKNWDLDRPGTATQDVDSFNMGARVRF